MFVIVYVETSVCFCHTHVKIHMFVIVLIFFLAGRISKLDNPLSSNHVTSSSLGSRLNFTNSTPHRRSPSPAPYQQSAIITMTREDGRIERRLETCSYQETEMVSRKCY